MQSCRWNFATTARQSSLFGVDGASSASCFPWEYWQRWSDSARVARVLQSKVFLGRETSVVGSQSRTGRS